MTARPGAGAAPPPRQGFRRTPVDHALLPVVAYTDRLSAVGGEQVVVHASSVTPRGAVRWVALDHDGTQWTASAVTEVEPVALGHRDIVLGSYGHSGFRVPAGPVSLLTWVCPTLWPDGEAQLIAASSPASGPDSVLDPVLGLDAEGRVWFATGASRLSCPEPLQLRRWYLCAGGHDAAGTAFVAVVPAHPLLAEADRQFVTHAVDPTGGFPAATRMPPEAPGEVLVGPGLDGLIEAPMVLDHALDPDGVSRLAGSPGSPSGPAELPEGALAAWDLGADLSGWTAPDRLGGPPLRLHGLPTRAVPGRWWDGSRLDPRSAAGHYGAVHLHRDDQGDQGWPETAVLTLPARLPSGVYALEITAEVTAAVEHATTSAPDAGRAAVDRVPVVVRPAPGASRARLAVLLPTLTYLAYALEHAAPPGLPELCAEDAAPFARANGLHSWYDRHADGSPVVFCSTHRPLIGFRPDHAFRYTGCEHGLSADLRLLGWLRRRGLEVDLLTDHDLDAEGLAALAGYRGVITGAHPEYWTEPMLRALGSYLDGGGSLAYLGGNGFWWSAAIDPGDAATAEMRRGDVEERPYDGPAGHHHLQLTGHPAGMWQTVGHPQTRLVGVTPTAMGFVPGVGFRRTAASRAPVVAHLFAGLEDVEELGASGAVLGAGAAYEVDLANTYLGTPPEAVVIATARLPQGYQTFAPAFHRAPSGEDGASRLRADMVYLPTRAGGAVFSASSIAWIGALTEAGDDNPASRLTENALRGFLAGPTATTTVTTDTARTSVPLPPEES
ncbi:MAG: DUF6605 domain-containing protein [Kineosporiaceae bacterium]